MDWKTLTDDLNVHETRNNKPGWMDNKTFKCVKRKVKKQQVASNSFKWVQKKESRNFESEIAGNKKTDTKYFFLYVRSRSGVKESVSSLTGSSGDLIYDDRKKCELLRVWFSSRTPMFWRVRGGGG